MLKMVAKMDIKESPTRIIWVQDQLWSEVRKVKPKNTKRVKTTKQSPQPLPAPPPLKKSETNQTQKSANNQTTSSHKKNKSHSLGLMNLGG